MGQTTLVLAQSNEDLAEQAKVESDWMGFKYDPKQRGAIPPIGLNCV